MDKEIFWKAIKNNDARFNGAFVYGVSSTGVYCKPSCASRPPRRENVRFFGTFERAETEGFRACKRCRPKAENISPQTEMVLRVCEILENEEQVSLETLGAELGLSPAHLQKLFKQMTGVSPKKYAEMRRLEKFKTEIKKGSEIVEAMYEAGYGSSSRLYENVSGKLGMTPAVYKKGGKGLKIDYAIAVSELGKLLVARTGKGICAVSFGDTEKELVENLQREFPQAEISETDAGLKDFVEAILANLSGTRRSLDLPLDLRATAFQMKVWEALRKIPYGETVSYQQIAEEIGDKKAVRAVAGACAKNRAALIIPCHRVVRSDGNLSGYRWGTERKRAILKRESDTAKR